MADWFGKLMQGGRARARPATAIARVPTHVDGRTTADARPGRFDAIVQSLRDREPAERDAREKRQRWYRQSLTTDSAAACAASTQSSPIRLHRFGAKVPCRVTPEARALIDQLTRRFPGCTVSFPLLSNGQQAVMLTGGAGTERKQIGWIESRAEPDPKLCNVRNVGLSVETDGDRMLVLRFRYPATAATISRARGEAIENVATVDFTEVRPALESRPAERVPSPRLVWLTRSELEAMNAVGSRDYETFYVRFKLEVQAAVWSSLWSLLASAPESRWHRGAHYTVVREPNAAIRKIVQYTIDDTGRRTEIGLDLTYDAAAATDILLLSLDPDILADLADIYFTLESLGSADAYFLKEEFFAVIRRFWASAQSLTSCYGGDLAAILRMSQRVVPMPAQAALLRQDWANVRQSLLDRYGERGRKAATLLGQDLYRTRASSSGWPFAAFPAGEVNVGLRIVYRQEWRHLGVERGEVLRTVPANAPAPFETRRDAVDRRRVETTIQPGDPTQSLDAMARELAAVTARAMNWPSDLDGKIHIGARGLASRTQTDIEVECRESSRDSCERLNESVLKMARSLRNDSKLAAELLSSAPVASDSDDAEATRVYHRLLNRYDVRTRPNEIENVVFVAEKLPSPTEIDLLWVRRHDWILATVLLDESFRDAIATIGREDDTSEAAGERKMTATRDRLYEHLRANILHYQRAIWAREDPQQRGMRYRKLGKKVPLDWRFELEAGGALTLEDLGDRLTAKNVDAQFAAYSPGREVDLDQLIDPAAPIGYHANYAVYRMRPEFARPELFSMLHFFKSPYLWPDAETGVPAVEDPVEMMLAEGAAGAAPEGTTVRLTRQIALETNGVIIDVLRPVESHTDPVEAPQGECLLLENEGGNELLCASGCRDAPTDWEILQRGEEHALLAGQSWDLDAPPAILAHDDGETLTGLRAGALAPEVGAWTGVENDLTLRRTTAPAAGDVHILHSEAERLFTAPVQQSNESVMLFGDDAERRLLVIGPAGGVEAHQSVILSGVNTAWVPCVDAVRPHENSHELVLSSRDDGGRACNVIVGQAPTLVTEQLILAGGDSVFRLGAPGADAVPQDGPVIHMSDEGEWTPRLRVGAAAGRARELVVLVRDDEWLRPSLIAS